MADCSLSGTALDRALQAAAGASGVASSQPQASAAAARALSGFLGDAAVGTANNAGGQLMPLAPPVLGGAAPRAAAVQHQSAVSANGNVSQSMGAQHAPMGHQSHRMHHQSQHMHSQFHPQGAALHPQQAMMMQQTMMMQQQQAMAAMVQFQKQQQQHQQQQLQRQRQANATAQQREGSGTHATTHAAKAAENADDDLVTVGEEEAEQLHHEGLTEDASIERLARAWRDAEAEFAEEFGDDEYDVSDLGGLRTEAHRTDHAGATNGEADATAADPLHYDFSEASRSHGCLVTPATDIAPADLSFPDNLYDRGLAHFDEGDLRSAILCFESTLRNIDPDHADAWRMLGKCHAENDEDARAIVCWKRALEGDPFSAETRLMLGVACVNELDHEGAVECLRGWVANHPGYAGMALDDVGTGEEDAYGEGGEGRRSAVEAGMRDVERILLRALEFDRSTAAAADVHEALGVVYNVSRDYDAAAAAFRRALAVRPDDYQLHNRLGATLANGNRSDEALPAYREALRLKPRYARGWLNMAISHSNLHNYPEAARCYLQTLALNRDAGHVWGYLRIALTCDERWDLLPAAAARDLAAFREHFDFTEFD
ncbi:hypothetical protein ACHAXT_001527 [Thalassiosira profunda]